MRIVPRSKCKASERKSLRNPSERSENLTPYSLRKRSRGGKGCTGDLIEGQSLGTAEVSPRNVCLIKIRILNVGVDELRVGQVRTRKICADQDRTIEHGTGQILSKENRTAEVNVSKLGASPNPIN